MADAIVIGAMLEALYRRLWHQALRVPTPPNRNGRGSQEWHRSREIDCGWLLAWPHGA
uniref:Uncharacterized protein n=1 Tax=Phocoena sinus TaxID=42100 RepID=A0A8C9BMR0_PHOSS